MDFDMQQHRDRSIMVQCIKCSTRIAQIEIRNMFRTGFYICETCFLKLEEAVSKINKKEIN